MPRTSARIIFNDQQVARLVERSAIAAVAGGNPAELEQRLKFPIHSLPRGSSVFGADRRAICAKQLGHAPGDVICKYRRDRFHPYPAQASWLRAPSPARGAKSLGDNLRFGSRLSDRRRSFKDDKNVSEPFL